MALHGAALERLAEIADRCEIGRDRGRVQRHHLRLGGKRGKVCLACVAAAAQRFEPLAHLGLGDAARRDLIDDAGDLALGLAEPSLGRLPLCRRCAGQALAFRPVSLEIALDRARVCELGLKPVDHALLDLGKAVGLSVRTEPAFLPAAAIHPPAGVVDVIDRHRRAAAAAAQQARQQMLRPAGQRRELLAAIGLDRLRRRESLGVDDAQLGHRARDPFALRVDARHALARVRVFAHRHPIPDQATVVEGVGEDAGPALRVAVDGGCEPARTSRRLDAVAVQILGDAPRRTVGDVFAEDAPHDLGLVLDDDAGAFLWARRVAIGEPAGGFPLEDAPPHAAPRVPLQILQGLAVEHRADTIDDAVDDTLARRLDRDIGEGQALADKGTVFLIAADAAHALAQDDAERTARRFRNELLYACASVNRGARRRGVLIDPCDAVALALGVVATQRDLIADRPVILQVAGKAGVDRGAFHGQGCRSAAAACQ